MLALGGGSCCVEVRCCKAPLPVKGWVSRKDFAGETVTRIEEEVSDLSEESVPPPG